MSNPFTKIADGIANAIGDVVDAVQDAAKGVEQDVEQTITKPLPGVSAAEQEGKGFFDPLPPAEHSGFKNRIGAKLTPVELLAQETNRIIFARRFDLPTSVSIPNIETGSYEWCLFSIYILNFLIGTTLTPVVSITQPHPIPQSGIQVLYETVPGIPRNHGRVLWFTAGKSKPFGRGPLYANAPQTVPFRISSRYLGHIPYVPSRLSINVTFPNGAASRMEIIGQGDVL